MWSDLPSLSVLVGVYIRIRHWVGLCVIVNYTRMLSERNCRVCVNVDGSLKNTAETTGEMKNKAYGIILCKLPPILYIGHEDTCL